MDCPKNRHTKFYAYIILSIRYRKGFSQICSTWFLQYSGRLGTAKGIRRIVLHGFYSIPGDKVQQKEFEELFSMVFAAFRGIRYSKRNSKNCSPWFLQYFGRLGTAVPFLRFVPLDFSNICSTITRNLSPVPKSLDRSEIYGGHLKEICRMCLKRLTKTELHGGHLQEICILYLKQIHGNNFEESSCAYPNMK